MFRLLFLLILIFFVSCNRNGQNNISQETIKESDNVLFENIITENTAENNEILTNVTSFPKIMYVTAKEGLRKRSEPSIDGDITGLLLYGERIIIHERSDNIDTIDEISEYWYRVKYYRDKNEWIFGGFIAENLPSDLPIILGKWDNIIDTREEFSFLHDHRYGDHFFSNSRKETSFGIWGKWEINGSIIRIYDLWAGQDYSAVHGELVNHEENIQLEIIDNNNIILTYSGGKVTKLVRSGDLW